MELKEIDRLVAEKVMGWKLTNYYSGRDAVTPKDFEDAAYNDGWCWSGDRSREAWQFSPSTKIAVTWDVVDHFKGDVEVKRQNGWYFVTLYVPSMQYQGSSRSLPEALCEALLKAHGVSV